MKVITLLEGVKVEVSTCFVGGGESEIDYFVEGGESESDSFVEGG